MSRFNCWSIGTCMMATKITEVEADKNKLPYLDLTGALTCLSIANISYAGNF